MRIRKTASKVLGLSSPPPVEDYHHCADALPEELLLCQLNCSPWDVMELDSNLHHFTLQEGGGDEGRGIMGNGFKFEDYDEIFASAQESAATTFTSFGSTAADDQPELNSEEVDDKNKKKKRGRKRKEKVINVIKDNDQDNKVASKNSSSITYCKKNDGKGWQCKRPANSQHSLCNHHLDLLRNYSSRTNNRETYESETDQRHTIKNQRPKAAAAAGSAGDGFYYYSGFGPCRGKKRSSGGTLADHARPKEEDASEEDEDDDDELDAPVAGDDLDDDTDEEDDDVESKGRYRKKGGKRVKSRSLKSLM